MRTCLPPRPIVYDITRLITRFSRPVPNGIDRVDIGYASHFLSSDRGGVGALLGATGPRAIDNAFAHRVASSIADHWNEGASETTDDEYLRVIAKLQGIHHDTQIAQPDKTRAHRRSGTSSLLKLLANTKTIGPSGLLPGHNLRKSVPHGAAYLNIGQFPLWIDGYFRWLDARPDIKPIFFIHDLLPITHPEFFPPSEAKRHAGRIEVASRRAAVLLVSSEANKADLIRHIGNLGRPIPRIEALTLPVSGDFQGGDLGILPMEPPYFVTVGTIEPRKNHILLLQVWRELAARMGPRTPKLVIAGVRGWDNENCIDMLERCPSLRHTVIETGQLSTPSLRRLLAGCRALLMPSLAEGFGLPVSEGLAAGIHVIASKIPAFESLAHPRLKIIDPLDGISWLEDVERYSNCALLCDSATRLQTAQQYTNWVWHLQHVEKVINTL